MTTLTIYNLDDNLREKLSQEAARQGCSMEETAHQILRRHLDTLTSQEGLGSRLHKRFGGVNGVELELPARSPARYVDFSEIDP